MMNVRCDRTSNRNRLRVVGIDRATFQLVYEETAQIVDLSVSTETLLAILRKALAEQPDRVEILVRSRHDPAPAADLAARAGTGRRGGAEANLRYAILDRKWNRMWSLCATLR